MDPHRLTYCIIPEKQLTFIRQYGMRLAAESKLFLAATRRDCLQALYLEEKMEDLALLKILLPSDTPIYDNRYVTRSVPLSCITIIDTDSARRGRGARPFRLEGR